jgi:hypothetical protein
VEPCAAPSVLTPALFENPDRSHCFQAVLRSVLHQALPERSFTWEELDRLSGKRLSCWTWPTTALLRLREMGVEVVTLESFDYQAFAERGEEYLAEHLGADVARAQARHSDLPYEREAARRFLEQGSGSPETRAPDFADLERLLRHGYLVVCNVNVALLKGGRGYSGHFVLVYALDEANVWLHDPGPPSHPAQRIPRERFMAAWAFPDERAKNLMAFKSRTTGG